MQASVITRPGFDSVKTAIHRKLIQKLNLARLTEVDRDRVRHEVGQIIETLVVSESTPMTLQEREQLAQAVLDEVFGLGPLESLLKDPTISDILVSTHENVYTGISILSLLSPKNLCLLPCRVKGKSLRLL